MAGAATLICPKCRGEMRTYERNGVQVDQCEECRGIFLDRGELEQLLEAADPSVPAEHSSEEDREQPHVDHERSRGRRRASPTSFISDLLGGGE